MGGGTTSLVVPPFLKQESLIMIFVALGLGIVGMAFARIQNKGSFQMHQSIITGAVALNLIAIFVVMIPSLIFFYLSSSLTDISFFSTLQLIHGLIGLPTVIFSLMFAFNFLPIRTKNG